MSARSTALAVLERCRRDGAWSGAALDAEIRRNDLTERDAALASALCLGVIQNSSFCDYYIDTFCDHKLEPKVRDILRLGIYQLLCMDRIPASAAVNESVKLTDKRAAGMVNAVLRKIAAKKNELPEIPGKGTPKYLSIRYSHPLAFTEQLCAEKGYSFAEQFLQADNDPAPLTLHINTLKISADAYKLLLRERGIVFTEFDGLPELVELSGGKVPSLPGFDDGLFFVQDRAAAAAVAAADVRPGMKVLDVCSAPGGKSFAAAIAMQNEGSILSCDIHEKKLERVRSGAGRLGIRILETKARDARQAEPDWNGKYDVVLADVPCSGFGVIRKKPEIRQKDLTEAGRLPEIQLAILRNVASYVAEGGVLLYSTCTILKAENEAVVEQFLLENTGFVREAFSGAPAGEKTFWPHLDHTDGFFAAKLRRR